MAGTPSFAANYGGFGSTYPAVLDPTKAVLVDENVRSEDFKSGLTGLRQLITNVDDLLDSLVSLPRVTE